MLSRFIAIAIKCLIAIIHWLMCLVSQGISIYRHECAIFLIYELHVKKRKILML